MRMFELKLIPSFKIWLSNSKGDYVIGKGGADLLTAIDETHSLSKATEKLRPKKISYRKAWGMLRKIKEHIGQDPVETTSGGKGGGGTILTDAGRKLLEAYLEFEKVITHANLNFEKKMKKK
jgi:molybdate transport system regulatory protein